MFTRTITRFDRQYRVSAEIDDGAIMEDQFAIDVSAECRQRSGDSWGECQKVQLRLEIRGREEAAVLLHGEHEVGRISLNHAVPGGEDSEGNDMDVEAEDAALAPVVAAFDWTRIDEAIDDIPTGDPVFGCLVRGAISTVVGQAIRCWKQVGVRDRLRDHVWAVLGCLRESGLRMSFTFVYRVGKCMVKAGL